MGVSILLSLLGFHWGISDNKIEVRWNAMTDTVRFQIQEGLTCVYRDAK